MNSDPLLNNKINSIIELYSSGQLSDALESIEILIGQNPNESILYNISGVCLKANGKLEIAAQSFKSAINLKPNLVDAHYNLALTLQELNQLDDAIKSYKETLSIDSTYAKAYINLGIVYQELGQMEEAIKSYEKLISIQPDNAVAHHNLGNLLTDLGELDNAIKSYKNALIIQPDYFEVLNNLGSIHHELGQNDEAINCYELALTINPDFADAHNNIGIIHQSIDQFDEAANCYKKAIAINPDHSEALSNLGNILKECGQFNEAIEFYEKALIVNQKFDDAHYNLGISLYELGKTDKAIDSFKEALSLNPNYSDAHNSLGNIFQDSGLLDEAFNSYVHALAIEPDNAQFHRNLSVLKNYKDGDMQVRHMESLLSKKNLIEQDRISLCFALAKAYQNLDKEVELFKVLNEGNHLRKKELNYSIETDLKKHLTTKKLFKLVNKKISQYEPITIRPIFIVGMPRSGTTLVEQIISSHDKVYGAGELTSLDNLIIPILNEYSSNNHALSEKNFFSIRKGYLNSIVSLKTTKRIITDKMPVNFENIGFILKAFPEAKIIHLKRDAMAVCWSIYQRYFPSKSLGFPYNMNDLAQFYNSYGELMSFWHELFPNQIYDISYEDLTTNQIEETRKLLEYCELNWDENCLNFYSNKREVKTASSLQVKEPIYQGSSEVWKKYETQLNLLIKNLSY